MCDILRKCIKTRAAHIFLRFQSHHFNVLPVELHNIKIGLSNKHPQYTARKIVIRDITVFPHFLRITYVYYQIAHITDPGKIIFHHAAFPHPDQFPAAFPHPVSRRILPLLLQFPHDMVMKLRQIRRIDQLPGSVMTADHQFRPAKSKHFTEIIIDTCKNKNPLFIKAENLFSKFK